MPAHIGKVAACLITRDRADLVTRAIASVQDHVDGVFVYDTGSTDDTVERLSVMEDVAVERGEWRDDFSWARNMSFEMPGDEYEWLVWLDDDDVLVGETTIRDQVARLGDRIDVFAALYEMGPGLSGERERVIRRDLGLLWEGVVHEQIPLPDAAAFYYIPPDELRWVHASHAKTDPDRNYRLLMSEISADRHAARSSSPRTLYYAAIETAYRWMESRDPALIDEVRSFFRDSLKGQPVPRPIPGGWLPFPDRVVHSLPGPICQLFRRASGAA